MRKALPPTTRGNDKYLAFIAESNAYVAPARVMKKVFHQIGGEWKVFVGPPTYSPSSAVGAGSPNNRKPISRIPWHRLRAAERK